MAKSRSTSTKRLVFLSHSSRDTWVAKQIAREMTACGVVPFLDEADIETGIEFEDAILEFLSKADELLVLLTPWALDRPYIWAEIGAAWGRRISIVAILHGVTAREFQARSDIPVLIKKRNLIELNDIARYFKELRVGRRGRRIRPGGYG
jgi:hypothetical protein